MRSLEAELAILRRRLAKVDEEDKELLSAIEKTGVFPAERRKSRKREIRRQIHAIRVKLEGPYCYGRD